MAGRAHAMFSPIGNAAPFVRPPSETNMRDLLASLFGVFGHRSIPKRHGAGERGDPISAMHLACFAGFSAVLALFTGRHQQCDAHHGHSRPGPAARPVDSRFTERSGSQTARFPSVQDHSCGAGCAQRDVRAALAPEYGRMAVSSRLGESHADTEPRARRIGKPKEVAGASDVGRYPRVRHRYEQPPPKYERRNRCDRELPG